MQPHYYRPFAFRQLPDFALMILLLRFAENDFQSDGRRDPHSCNVPFRSGKFLFAALRVGPGITSAVGTGT